MLMTFGVCFGVTVILCSSSWWMGWVGLEITTLFFIPLMKMNGWKGIDSQLWVYFLIQTISSSLFLISSGIFMSSSLANHTFSSSEIASFLFLIPLMLKLGIPPFHKWAILLSTKISWEVFAILMTLIKIGPIIILMNLVSLSLMSNNLLLMIIVIIIMPLSFGAKELNIRHLMIYSGIVSMGWIIASMALNASLSLLYMTIYFLSMILIMKHLASVKMESLFQISSLWLSIPFSYKLTVVILILNVIGFPITPIFFVKMIILFNALKSNMMLALALIMLSSIFIKALIPIFIHLMLSSNSLSISLYKDFKSVKLMLLTSLFITINLFILF